MVRWGVLAAGAAVVVGAALVTGASVAPPRAANVPPKPEEIKGTVIGQKTGYFNMAAVIREYKRARTGVVRLNARRDRMSANLVGMKEMYKELQAVAQKATNEDQKYQLGRDAVMLARHIEDLDREINKLLNDQALVIIAELHDEIQAEVVEIAREHGLVAVLTYPDAVTPEEKQSPMVKELKLKPPAAHPFYLDPSVDYTDELIRRLNDKFAAENDGK
jgi:Skp family chaperone for outer membrane proteins